MGQECHFAPKERLSKRAIAAKLQLPKATAIERLSGRWQGHGNIIGARESPEFSWQVSKWVTKQVTSLVPCTTDPLGFSLSILSLLSQFSIEQEDEPEDLVMYYARRGFPFTDEKLCQFAFELASKTQRKGFSPTRKAEG